MTVTLPVFVIGMVWKRATQKGMMFAAVSAFVLNVISLVLNQRGFVWPAGLPWYMYVICFTTVSCILVSFFTYDKEKEQLDKKLEAVMNL